MTYRSPKSLISDVDCAPAIRSAAIARHTLDVFVEMVVDCQLLTRMNIANTHIKNVFFEDPGVDIRVAAMVDILRPATAGIAVNRPVSIQREDIVQRAL